MLLLYDVSIPPLVLCDFPLAFGDDMDFNPKKKIF